MITTTKPPEMPGDFNKVESIINIPKVNGYEKHNGLGKILTFQKHKELTIPAAAL